MILLRTGESDSFLYLLLSAAAIALSIFPWCVLMGTTFPFMMAFIKQLDRAETKSFSFLYLANVLGAMSGTVVTAVILVELLGFRHTLWVAGFSNLAVAAIAWGIGQRSSCPPLPAPIMTEPVASVPFAGRAPLTKTILFMTGFSSLAMEVVWTRAFTPVLRTQVYSFALLLFIYLFATWVGSCWYRGTLRRKRVLSNAQVLALLAVFAFLPIVLNDPRILFGITERPGFGVQFTLLSISIFLLCAALGYLTPKLIDDYSNGDALRAGRSYALNVLGCILGPLCASYLLLPYLGVKLSLVALAVPFLVFFWLSSRDLAPIWRGVTAVVTSVFVLSSLFFHTSYEDAVGRNTPTYVVRRDHTATVISYGQGMKKGLLVNGIGITELTPITKFMAHLPLAFHRGKPESALVICFGMGTTYRSLLTWDVRATAIELVPSVRDAFGYYFEDAKEILKNPKGQIVIDDGSRFLRRTKESFDVVTIDPPPPAEAAGSSLLYSEEMYADVKRRLNAGGIVQQWFPGGDQPTLQAVAHSLGGSFPHVRIYQSGAGWGFHFLASMSPIEVPSAATMVARLPERARADLLEWSGNEDLRAYVHRVLSREVPIEAFLPPDPRTRITITDDQPFNEYFLLRTLRARVDGSQLRSK